MCFGVRDAIDLALRKAAHQPLTILGELVHNENVVSTLRDRGIEIETDLNAVETALVMITAHGTSQRTLDQARGRGLNVTEATCPLVRHAHQAVARFVTTGYHPVIIGKRDHVEVRGITDDRAEFDVILNEADVERLEVRPRFGVAAQTTQPFDRVCALVTLIQKRFPKSEVRFADTVCQPTKQRQSAAVELAEQCDLVIVVGGAHSNNTQELVATCRRHCPRVHHVQSAFDLRPEWFAQGETFGITAGTSTPDSIIDAVEQAITNTGLSRIFEGTKGDANRPQVLESAKCGTIESVFSAG